MTYRCRKCGEQVWPNGPDVAPSLYWYSAYGPKWSTRWCDPATKTTHHVGQEDPLLDWAEMEAR